MLQGTAANVEHDDLPLGASYATVLDAGANRGQFAVYARKRYPGARLLCFEPLEEPRQRLEGILAGDARLEVFPYALGAADNSSAIHVSARDDSSSLLPITDLQTGQFPGTHQVREVEIPIRTLDGLLRDRPLEDPVLLKIDVQGFELEVLRGEPSTLEKVDTLSIEASFVEYYRGQCLFPEVYAHLVAAGFRLTGGLVSTVTDRPWQQGTFCFDRRS